MRALFLGTYLGLAGLQWLWHGLLAPSHPALLLMAMLPLLIPLPWLVRVAAPRARVLATYLSLFYFVHGLTESLVSGQQRGVAFAEIGLCLALYILLILDKSRPVLNTDR